MRGAVRQHHSGKQVRGYCEACNTVYIWRRPDTHPRVTHDTIERAYCPVLNCGLKLRRVRIYLGRHISYARPVFEDDDAA